MKKYSLLLKNLLICLVAISIPAMLALDGVQARRYATMEKEITGLEQRQSELIESNKNLITGISILSSADRIEKIAAEQLNMRLAESSEIIRVEMTSSGGSER